MLTRLFRILPSVLLGAAGLAALAPDAASAGPCPGADAGDGSIDVCSGLGVGLPGTGGGDSPGGSGGGGGSAPLPDINCPQIGGVVVCPPGQANPAPIPHTPTTLLVNTAIDSIGLPIPRIHNSPNPATFVRVKTHLWVNQADFDTFTAEARAPAGELEQVVTATAEPLQVEWNMGESRITCKDAGRPNTDDCSYTYNRSSASQPNKEYRISATITWAVEWECNGIGCDDPGGDLGETGMTAFKQLVVDEVQTESGSRS